LEKAAQDLPPYQEEEPPSPVMVEGEEEYKVKWVDDSRLFQRELQYLVKWRGYDECSGEPAANLYGLKAIDNFHPEQPGNPGL
jgi:hypothetical protein